MADDYASNPDTAGIIVPGATVSGVFETVNDRDWFKFTAVEGVSYQFSLSPGADGGYLASGVPALWVKNASGNAAAGVWQIGDGATPIVVFKPATSGDYFLDVSGNLKASGSYSVRSAVLGTDDHGDTNINAATLALGATLTGRLELDRDLDVFKVMLEAGKTYTLTTIGIATGGNLAAQPVAAFFKSGSPEALGHMDLIISAVDGVPVASFTPITSGVYYAAVSPAYGVGGTGAYQITLGEAADDHGANPAAAGQLAVDGAAVKGVINIGGDIDWFKMTVQANQSYLFTLEEAAGAATLSVVDAHGTVLGSYTAMVSGLGQMLAWSAPSAGDYYLQVRTRVNEYGTPDWTGFYALKAQSAQADDFGDTIATTGLLAAGQTLMGRVESLSDRDWIKVKLQAGATYVFGLSAATQGDGSQKPLAGLTLLDASGATMQYGDHAVGNGFSLNYTAASSGDYFLVVYGDGVPLSSYGLTWYGALADAIKDDASTQATLTEGGVVRGMIDTPSDRDWYRVDLVANNSYRFALDGAASLGGTLGAEGGRPVLKLFDAAGRLLTGSSPFSSDDPELSYATTTSGSYYLEVSSSGLAVGSYTLKEALHGIMPDTRAPQANSLTGPTAQDALDANLVVGFTEAVLLGNGIIKLSTAAGVLVESFDSATSSRLSVDRGALTIDPSASLLPGTDYVLEIGIGSVKDSAGNAYFATSTQIFHTGNAALNLVGGAGNDVFHAGRGGGVYDGGAGIDTLVLGSSRNFYAVSHSGLSTSLRGPDETHMLTNIERLQFADRDIAYDLDGNAGQVYRLYQAAFDRQPDSGGLGFWIAQADQGASLRQVAAGFVASAEFASLYGTAPTDTVFLTALYQNVLHRAPDPTGLDFWSVQLQHGAARAELLSAFSESAENQSAVFDSIQSGIEYTPFL